MPKIAEYPRAYGFDANDVLLKDGTNGTKKIQIEDLIADVSDTTGGTSGKLAKASDITDLEHDINDLQYFCFDDVERRYTKSYVIPTGGSVLNTQNDQLEVNIPNGTSFTYILNKDTASSIRYTISFRDENNDEINYTQRDTGSVGTATAAGDIRYIRLYSNASGVSEGDTYTLSVSYVKEGGGVDSVQYKLAELTDSVAEAKNTEINFKMVATPDGKNLFDSKQLLGDGITYSNGVFSGTGAAFESNFGSSTSGLEIFGGFEENQQYVLSLSGRNASTTTDTGQGLYVYILYTDDTTDREVFHRSQITFSRKYIASDANKTIKKCYLAVAQSPAIVWEIKDVQVEKGTSLTSYEAFKLTAYDKGARADIKNAIDIIDGILFETVTENPSNAYEGKILNNTGWTGNATGYNTSQAIDVTGCDYVSLNYSLKVDNVGNGAWRSAIFFTSTSMGTGIVEELGEVVANKMIPVPATAKYLRISYTSETTPTVKKHTAVKIADAEYVDEVFGEISEDTYNINTAGSGRYNANTTTGVISDGASSNYFGMANKIPCSPSTLYTASAFKITYGATNSAWYVLYYDENGDYISNDYISNNSNYKYTVTTPATAKYLYVYIYCSNGISTSADSAIQVESGAIAHAYITPKTGFDMDARNQINSVDTPVEITITEKPGVYTPTGGIGPEEETQLVYTNKIDVRSLYAISWDLAYTENKSMWLAYAAFDEKETFIERPVIIKNVDTDHQEGVLEIPSNASYIAFTYRTFGIATFSASGRASVGKVSETLMGINDLEIDRNTIRSSIGVNVHRFKPFYDHLFIDTINGNNVIIPSESLFNIQISHRLGFDMIEANVHRTSDGHFIIMHGVQGKFGAQVEHVDGETDISNTAINSVTLSWIKTNVRYKSLYAKYRVAPPSLEEFLLECRKNCMIPLVTAYDTDALAIIDNIMGIGNYVAYRGTRDKTCAPIFTYESLNSVDDILALCNSYGKPYMYGMENPTSFTDAQLTEIVETLHTNGYLIGFAGCYETEAESQRLFALGFDYSTSGYQINDFESGNICNLSADIDYSDFATTGMVTNNLLTLAVGETIEPDSDVANIPNSVFLGGGSLHIRFNGTIKINMGTSSGRHIKNVEISSDGSQSLWFSTYYLNEKPTFSIEAVSSTDIINIDFKASKM